MRERRSNASSAWDLILAERDSMMRVALSRTRNRDDAEDLVQEAMTRAAAMPDLHHRTAGSLLRTIVINLAIDQHRRTSRQSRYEARLSADARTVAPVDEEVCDRSEAHWLREVVQESAGRDQQVLLHRAAGHSVRSSAELLGLTYKAAESAFTRARHRARLAWEATLALLLGGLAGLRRALRAAPVAGAAVTVGLTLAISAVPGPQLGGLPLLPQPPGSETLLTRGFEPSASSYPEAAGARPLTPGGIAPPRAVDTGRLGDRRLVSTGVALEDARQDETLVETLDRCLRNGVVVSPRLVGCR